MICAPAQFDDPMARAQVAWSSRAAILNVFDPRRSGWGPSPIVSRPSQFSEQALDHKHHMAITVCATARRHEADLLEADQFFSKVPTPHSRLQRYRLRFGSFRHPKAEDGQGHDRGGAGGEKGGVVPEAIDDHAGSQPA